MKSIHLVLIGKLKDKSILSLELDYIKRIKSFNFTIHECKGHKEDIHQEIKELKNKAEQLETKFGPFKRIVLSEHGQTLSSTKLSTKIYNIFENENKNIIFFIGGAAGFTKDFINECDYQLSLSPMTFPHKLARLIFIEQLYRAETINSGHPYHKD